MKFRFITLGLLLLPTFLVAQFADSTTVKNGPKYAVNPWVSVPAIALGGWASQQRLISLQDKPRITAAELQALDPNDVAGIDRIALRQDFSTHKQGILWSDRLFSAGQFAPFGLFIWKKYRQDWLDISLMYLEAQVTQGLFYGFAPFGPTQINRYRPRVYYEEAELDSRTNGNQRNSVFSGHVSTMSTGFYFMAKMIDDYNPQLTGGQRVLLYVGASVPSVAGSWLRVKAVKHYPTDTMIGLGVGAISGILVPELHRWWARRHRSRLAVTPHYTGSAGGVGLSMLF